MWSLTDWKKRAKQLKIQVYTIYLAYQDPRVSWYTKLLAILIVGYAFSPIDIIPDFIPILGYLDDLILIPLGIALLLKIMPKDVLEECKEKAEKVMSRGKPKNWVAAGIIIAIWILSIVLLYSLLIK